MKKSNWREIAKEIELDPKQDPMSAQTLRLISLESEALSEVPMPAGYEERLIQSLRRKLPLDAQPKVAARVGLWSRFSALVVLPQFRVGIATGFALLALVIGLNVHNHQTNETASITESMLIKTAKTSNTESVDTWISSISDSASLTAGRDIASLSEEITKSLNSNEQKKVLNSFAGADSGDI